jgi:hypothetical protein
VREKFGYLITQNKKRGVGERKSKNKKQKTKNNYEPGSNSWGALLLE